MPEEPSVVVSCVSKVYGRGAARIDALRGVSFVLARGEFVTVMGPSGCGKSTLLNLLAGLDAPSSGTILVAGTDIGRLDEEQRTRFRGRHIGVVFQSFNLLDILTAEENVAMPLTLAGVAATSAIRSARQALDHVGLARRGQHYPAEMSGGEQQRVAVARALVSNPALIVADEPTGNLDTDNGLVVFDLLREIVGESQRTVLMVTHDSGFAQLADRTIRLVDGAVVP